jgi:hypothetical protein
MNIVTLVFATLIVLGGPAVTRTAGSVSAQSLGRVASEEADRRKTIAAPSKVITNNDLAPVEAVPRDQPAPPVPAPAVSTNAPPEPKYVSRDASYWLARMRELQTKLDRFKLMAAALQARLDSLQPDFTTAYDRFRASRFESERETLRTERALVTAEADAVSKQIRDLEDEARRSNVPPGWLRP